jgi:hypothetical protein
VFGGLKEGAWVRGWGGWGDGERGWGGGEERERERTGMGRQRGIEGGGRSLLFGATQQGLREGYMEGIWSAYSGQDHAAALCTLKARVPQRTFCSSIHPVLLGTGYPLVIHVSIDRLGYLIFLQSHSVH